MALGTSHGPGFQTLSLHASSSAAMRAQSRSSAVNAAQCGASASAIACATSPQMFCPRTPGAPGSARQNQFSGAGGGDAPASSTLADACGTFFSFGGALGQP